MIMLPKPCGHFEEFVKSVDYNSRLNYLTNSSKCPHGLGNIWMNSCDWLFYCRSWHCVFSVRRLHISMSSEQFNAVHVFCIVGIDIVFWVDKRVRISMQSHNFQYNRTISIPCSVFEATLVRALWRTKKSHFQPSEEMRMKNVDKDAVITKIGLILLSRCMKTLKMNIIIDFKSFNACRYQNRA